MLRRQNVRSMLQCAVRDGGRFIGFVGFDDCTVLRRWTQNQIDALIFVSELLSTFLLKKRAQDQAVSIAENLRMILDNQDSWIYVIDPDTYALLYINAKNPAHSAGCKGRYELSRSVFFHRDHPCEHCPVRDIKRVGNRTLEVYNPFLNIWTMADASVIRWGKEEACLISCHDITRYKQESYQKMNNRGTLGRM